MRRVLSLFLAAGGLLLGLAGSGRAADEVQAILEKAIKAHGGEAKLAAIKAVKIKSRGSSLTLFTFKQDGKTNEEPADFTRETAYLFPDQFKEDTSMKTPLGNLRIIQLLNKDKGSVHHRGVIRLNEEAKGNELTELKEQLHRMQVALLVCLKDKAYTLSPLGEVKVADKSAAGIRVKAKCFRDINLFFDKKTGRLAKVLYQLREKGKEVFEEEIVTEYQQVGGVSVPKKIVVHRDGDEVGDEEFVETKLLETLDEKEFAAPQAPKKLGIGDAAPKLTVKEFVKGKAVRQFERGKIYVVELWATWCGPCRQTIPHLTKLQKKYPDVTVIGVSVSEPDPAKVKPFVEEMGEKMDYRVATDLEDAMVKNWLQAAGRNGIPTAFIVDGNGKIAWIGHPGAINEPLEKVRSGKWDLKAAAAEFAKAKKDKAARRVARVPEAERAAVRAVEELGGEVGQKGEGQPITAVDLSGTQVTDAGLKKLKELKELRQLSLVGCDRVTDTGLKELKELKGLQTLFLGGTPVTDAGLKELKGLKELRELGLGRTRVTDGGLKELKGLKELRRLFFVETKVTDAGLKEFKELKELRQLYLGGTEVTDEGVAELKKALPELTVER